MDRGPRFSIIVPCFNQGAFLEECLHSISAQTLPPHEVIVVNDGSTDPWTVKQLEAQCRAPVQLINQENRGLAGARNTGIRRATGDWILPLDCDDQLEPTALETYARAIADEPAIDIWYPDIVHFGIENDIWECPTFNQWRELWSNQMVCSSAIRRKVFDDGVLYNERMRHGYEDWEFYVHACCEASFSAKALKQPVFRYRRWGHSMLSDSNSRAAQIKAQLQNERPVFRDHERLFSIKTSTSPYFAVAARGPELEPALRSQALRDYRVVDAVDRVLADGDLAAFQGQLGAGLLVSFSDEGLGAALQADPLLLEKAARIHSLHTPGLMWLVTEVATSAYPGFLVERPGGANAVGVIISTRHLFEFPKLPRTDRGFIGDLQLHFDVNYPGSTLYMIAGPDGLAGARPVPAARQSSSPSPVPRAPVAETGNGGRLFHLGLGTSKLLRGVLGPSTHDRLMSNEWIQELKTAARIRDLSPLKAQVARSAPRLRRRREGQAVSEPTGPREGHREGPLEASTLASGRDREQAWFVATEKPKYSAPPAGTEGLLVVVPWIIHGGVDRAVIDLLRGIRELAPGIPCYLVTTIPAIHAWAEELLPHVDGVFDLHALGGPNPSGALVDLTKRLGVKTIMIANSRVGFDAIPMIRRELPEVRVVVQAHNFEPDPETGKPGGHVAYVASRYNNLVHGYTTISRKTAETLQKHFYVSPSKVKVVYLGVETKRFLRAQRERFRAGEPIEIMWLGRMTDEKNPFLALEVAAEWKARNGSDSMKFRIVGGGPLTDAVRQRWEEKRLQDIVELQGPVGDPVPLFRRADCLMLTSIYEGTPVVVFEALAAGVVPVTAISNSSLSEYLDSDAAYVVEAPREPHSFVNALERLKDDLDAARARARAGLAKGRFFDRERYAAETLEMLFPDMKRESIKLAAS